MLRLIAGKQLSKPFLATVMRTTIKSNTAFYFRNIEEQPSIQREASSLTSFPLTSLTSMLSHSLFSLAYNA